MCMYIDRTATKKLVESGRTTMRYWKVLYFTGQKLISPIIVCDWAPGNNRSDSRVQRNSNPLNRRGAIYHGIHVFASRHVALQWCTGPRSRVVAVTCHMADFVAAGHQRVVFTKVHLSRKAYMRACR